MLTTLNYKRDKQKIEERILNRSQFNIDVAQNAVKDIIKDVQRMGDEALTNYTEKYDHVRLLPNEFRVTQNEIEKAYQNIDPRLLEVLQRAKTNIRAFHEKQAQKTWMDIKEGIMVGQIYNPIQNVGVYVPGGTAAYPSSVLMNIIPAKVAGVERIVMVTPPGPEGKINDLTLISAVEAGADEIYKIGGAHAVAALAFGTKTVPKVDKIVGPGNIYVALAKREVYGHVGIDMIAGPSEILIIGDSTANPAFIAADLLSQAEHDALAAVTLITDSAELADKVCSELSIQAAALPRFEIIKSSLINHGTAIVVDDLRTAADLANQIAPEHLEIAVDHPLKYVGMIRNAGAIFLGHYSPEPLGDYYAGPNHVLPTSGTARFFSPLGVDDFMKKSSLIYYTKEALSEVYMDIIDFAKAEGLDAHANSIAVRFNKKECE